VRSQQGEAHPFWLSTYSAAPPLWPGYCPASHEVENPKVMISERGVPTTINLVF
jgi:hypothetical protein